MSTIYTAAYCLIAGIAIGYIGARGHERLHQVTCLIAVLGSGLFLL